MSWPAVRERIVAAATLAGRDARSIRVVAVSKGRSADEVGRAVAEAADFPRELGENYADEFALKHAALAELRARWHFMGRLQSRKIAQIAALADCLHGVERGKELLLLAAQPRVPEFFVQVNISGESNKGGTAPGDVPELLQIVRGSDRLNPKFCGLMGMAAERDAVGDAEVRRQFAALRALRDEHCAGAQLSMGMSDDFELAIAEGSDCLRIGSALFGARD